MKDLAHGGAHFVRRLGVDVGDGRIGLEGGAELEEETPVPAGVGEERVATAGLDDDRLVDEVQHLLREGRPGELVLGDLLEPPRHVGQDSEVLLHHLAKRRRVAPCLTELGRKLPAELRVGADLPVKLRVGIDVGGGKLAGQSRGVRLLGVEDGVVTELRPGGELGGEQPQPPVR